jgi:hypothetical protein
MEKLVSMDAKLDKLTATKPDTGLPAGGDYKSYNADLYGTQFKGDKAAFAQWIKTFKGDLTAAIAAMFADFKADNPDLFK